MLYSTELFPRFCFKWQNNSLWKAVLKQSHTRTETNIDIHPTATPSKQPGITHRSLKDTCRGFSPPSSSLLSNPRLEILFQPSRHWNKYDTSCSSRNIYVLSMQITIFWTKISQDTKDSVLAPEGYFFSSECHFLTMWAVGISYC